MAEQWGKNMNLIYFWMVLCLVVWVLPLVEKEYHLYYNKYETSSILTSWVQNYLRPPPSVEVQGVHRERECPLTRCANKKGRPHLAPPQTVVYRVHMRAAYIGPRPPWVQPARSCYPDLDKTNTRSTSTGSIGIIFREKPLAGIDFGSASHRFHTLLYPRPTQCVRVTTSAQVVHYFSLLPVLRVFRVLDCWWGRRRLIDLRRRLKLE